MDNTNAVHRPLGVGYVVIAEFEVKPERIDEFLALASAFSEECIESESGCWQFDVVQLDTRIARAAEAVCYGQ